MTTLSSWSGSNPAADTLLRVDTAIIGGGITGLSAAYFLNCAAQQAGTPLRIALIERSPRPGGKIRTDYVQHDGTFLVEGGPDSFIAQKPWGIELARELGLGSQLMTPNAAQQKTYLLWKGRPRQLPDGMLMIVPTRFLPFALSPLISPLGKLRMGMDFFIPPRTDGQDETLSEFIRRRLGNEALERLAEPLMAGIHSAECDRQSLLATFPRFRDLETKYGSLIRGMLAARRKAPRPAPGSPSTHSSPFITLRGGIGTLVQALIERFEGDLLLDRAVAELAPGEQARYRLRLDDGTLVEADSVILTTPTYTAADLTAARWPDLAAALRQFRYVSTATISLAFRQSDVQRMPGGFGLVIPKSEGRQINAVTFTSTKFSDRAPDDAVLLRVFTGGSRSPQAMMLNDDQMLAMVRNELREILGITAEPLFTRLYRWEQSNPQYDVGHLDRVAALPGLCPQGLFLAGGAYHGVGIPDCINDAKQAAQRVLALGVAAR